MILVIVESPTKAKIISKFLGRKYTVKSSFGHIRDLPKSELGVDTEKDFAPRYVIPAKARKTAKELKDLAKKSDLVILATDEDREGEAIAWHIEQALGQKNSSFQRIAFHEITKTAIEQALKQPRQLDLNLVNAQQARRILDRLVGYKLSPFLWKKIVKGLSAGRVQSVAVRLIVDREREIEAFKPEEYWSIEAEVKKQNQPEVFLARLAQKDGKAIGKLTIKNKQQADQILTDLTSTEYRISRLEKKQTQKSPLPPFTTSTLQQEASRKLGFSSKQTMMLAQQLYEGIAMADKDAFGLITYHRTDSLNLSQESVAQAKDFIAQEFGAAYTLERPRFFKTKSKNAQEAHEAVRPTRPDRAPEQIKEYLNPRQYKLYDLIWRRFLASQAQPALLDSTTADIQAKHYTFRANGSTIKFDGFLKIYPIKLKENILPPLAQKEILELIKLLPQQHFTQPPPRYNEASLIKTLEEYGIGRPSTYAPIISTIQERGYTNKDEQKRFIPTQVAFLVIDLLKENFAQIVDIQFTAQMEQGLDLIAQGEKDWIAALKEFYEPFAENLAQKYEQVKKIKTDEATDRACPQCGKPLVIKLGRFGKFYACTGFPECRHTEPIINSTNVLCPQCQKGDLIERKTKRGKPFYSCATYPKCKFALWDKPTGKKCPRCGALLTEAKGKTKCSNKECGYQETDH